MSNSNSIYSSFHSKYNDDDETISVFDIIPGNDNTHEYTSQYVLYKKSPQVTADMIDVTQKSKTNNSVQKISDSSKKNITDIATIGAIGVSACVLTSYFGAVGAATCAASVGVTSTVLYAQKRRSRMYNFNY